jgi:RNA polymerase Rpb1, domain 5
VKHPTVDHGRALGVEALSNYLMNEIPDAYRLQGVKVNDKHIKVIVRQIYRSLRSASGV